MHFKNLNKEFNNTSSTRPMESLFNSQSKCETQQDAGLSQNQGKIRVL